MLVKKYSRNSSLAMNHVADSWNVWLFPLHPRLLPPSAASPRRYSTTTSNPADSPTSTGIISVCRTGLLLSQYTRRPSLTYVPIISVLDSSIIEDILVFPPQFPLFFVIYTRTVLCESEKWKWYQISRWISSSNIVFRYPKTKC